MRLEAPFVRLPLQLEADELVSEVAALDPGVWRAHPEGAPGNTAVPLVAVDGDPTNDSTSGEMRPTPHLAQLPYVASVIAALGSVIGRTRLMRIEEEGELAPHVDLNYYWRDHLRVHVPILTTPDVEFECGGRQVHMAAGEVWVFDTWRPHLVRNPGRTPRVHLVIDTVGSEGLWDLIARPDRPPLRVELSAVGARFPTEAVNRPTVMTPWEVESSLDRLLTEAGHVDDESVKPLRSALGGWLHDVARGLGPLRRSRRRQGRIRATPGTRRRDPRHPGRRDRAAERCILLDRAAPSRPRTLARRSCHRAPRIGAGVDAVRAEPSGHRSPDLRGLVAPFGEQPALRDPCSGAGTRNRRWREPRDHRVDPGAAACGPRLGVQSPDRRRRDRADRRVARTGLRRRVA